MMEVASRSHPSRSVSFTQCSVEELPFRDASFDLTFTMRFLLHLPPPLRQVALSELARVSKRWVFFDCLMEGGPKGWLRRFCKGSSRRGKPKKRMEKAELMGLLDQAGLRIRRIYRPSWLFSEKWMMLCEKKQGDWIRGR
jgi:ubiquinone/menaquinone biosynthesis C-methylase UbiE